MIVPLHYQVSEYDCVPTTFINAIAWLYERRAIPPLVIRHIYAYCLDTVSRGGRLGRAGTSKYAIQLVGHWLASYKTRVFSVGTEYLEPQEVHLRPEGPIWRALENGGLALCNIHLGHKEWHFVLGLHHDDGWLYVFDPYLRTQVHRLKDKVRLLKPGTGREPNLAVRMEWLDRGGGRGRYTFGEVPQRECLLLWRVK